MGNPHNQGEQATLPYIEALRHLDVDGREYWLARELYKPFGYSTWQRFLTRGHRKSKASLQFVENQ